MGMLQLGQHPPPRDPLREATQLFEAFFGEWSRPGITDAGRAEKEQDFLRVLDAKTTNLERAVATAKAGAPIHTSELIFLRDKAQAMESNLFSVWINMPVVPAERMEHSTSYGFEWNGPADRILARLVSVKDEAQAGLDEVFLSFQDRPPVETPGHDPDRLQIPQRGEEKLAPGESGRRPRIPFIDDFLDGFRDYWWIPLVLVGGYIALGELEGSRSRPAPSA